MYIKFIGDLIFCCFVGNQKLSSVSAGMKGPQSHYDDVDLGLHSHLKTHSKTTVEPQYELCGGRTRCATRCYMPFSMATSDYLLPSQPINVQSWKSQGIIVVAASHPAIHLSIYTDVHQ